MMNWKQLLSTKRFGLEDIHKHTAKNRTEFQRDYDRLIFSAPFRRLQNKTQVFPLPGSVFVHNRLTHSLEVSCVGRSLGNAVSQELIKRDPLLEKETLITEIGSIIAAACLAHDLGNPPFGHSGEQAISSYFSEGEGSKIKKELNTDFWQDIIHFEGNANALRLLTHQFNGRREGGFAMTYSTLASIVKYPYESFIAGDKSKFGFFYSEKESYIKIASELGIIIKENEPRRYARHPLVYLVEAADDICYQLMDIEDAHKLRILSTTETKELLLNYLNTKQLDRAKHVFNIVSDTNEQIAYLRSTIIGNLVKECTHIFTENEATILNGNFEGDLISHLPERSKNAYNLCKKVAYSKIYKAKDVVDIELAGYKIISTLLNHYISAIQEPEKAYSKLLINRVSGQYDIQSGDFNQRVQAVLDFVSGMTDIYALDLYRKINGQSLPAI
ncbi:deoxyguanosinetriphosphate triphosphohydrolase [Bacteroides coprosuis DSM 18011]|uniref:Deoxyguanosinetriphosphate triphosphohydrolase n=1 Tax=Bacteroides coprosuis DSM 18011 TaxID=679937 RepID=F3ZQ31_9BACE|nr:deoxyguanosinetriphosphate triphosphohydrolase [Bacteroides coprosuis]EGJ70473.1 deoxyguanosinetriphosphate triphosphohydrolase [Bacteroides coprosuis DSM 18011]